MYPYRDYKISEQLENSGGITVKAVFYEGDYEDVGIPVYNPVTDTEITMIVSQYVRKNRTGSMIYTFPQGTTDEEITRTVNGTFNSDTERISIYE